MQERGYPQRGTLGPRERENRLTCARRGTFGPLGCVRNFDCETYGCRRVPSRPFVTRVKVREKSQCLRVLGFIFSASPNPESRTRFEKVLKKRSGIGRFGVSPRYPNRFFLSGDVPNRNGKTLKTTTDGSRSRSRCTRDHAPAEHSLSHRVLRLERYPRCPRTR